MSLSPDPLQVCFPFLRVEVELSLPGDASAVPSDRLVSLGLSRERCRRTTVGNCSCCLFPKRLSRRVVLGGDGLCAALVPSAAAQTGPSRCVVGFARRPEHCTNARSGRGLSVCCEIAREQGRVASWSACPVCLFTGAGAINLMRAVHDERLAASDEFK